jgi:mannose-6-phosphate isomerase-like protein (cupin superfamily)
VQRTVLADLDELAITTVRSEAGDAAPLRLHEHHASCVYVLEGRLKFEFEDGALEAGPETFVHVPPEAAGTLAVTGDGQAHFLDIRVPSALDSGSSILLRTGATAETVEVLGNQIAFLARAAETGGAIGAIEFTAPHAFVGPSAHIHRRMLDAVVVLEGTMDFQLGEETGTAEPGSLVLAPPGVAHTFSNPRESPLRLLDLYIPGGFERFFEERAAASNPKVARELTSRYDWEPA